LRVVTEFAMTTPVARRWLPSLLLLTACATPEVGSTEDEATAGWERVGFGVACRAVGTEDGVLLVYGGYRAEDVWVRRWAEEIVRARDLRVGAIYAVRGPDRPTYENLEIENSKLVAHLRVNHPLASRVLAVAHSSGTFVADETFRMMTADALARTRLYALDGGGVGADRLRRLARAYFVLACDATTGLCSKNAGSMRALGERFADLGGAFEVDATGSGCVAAWCLHDAVVNTRPANPAMYDLEADYTTFRPGRVVTAYFD